MSDVVVVGSGVVGASIALDLARSGYAVTVVDRAGAPGHGTTSASMAIIRFNYSTWAGVAAAWESRFRWESWADHLGVADPAGLVRFHRRGALFLDAPPLPTERTIELFDRAGIPWERWSADQIRAHYPGIDPGAFYPPKPVDAEEFFADPDGELGGIFTPDAGFVDDPQLAAGNLATAAKAHGVDFRFGTTVTGMQPAGSGWAVTTDRGDLHTALVVNAAGPWSGALNRMAGVDEDFTITTRPLRQEVHRIDAPPGFTGHEPVFADLDLGTYLRPDGPTGAYVGGTEPECDPLEWLASPDDVDPRPTRRVYDAQTSRAARRFPDLGVPPRVSGIVGIYDVASDWTPIYDRTMLPGYYVAMGTSGNQFKNAPLVGSLMAAIIEATEAGHDHDADPVKYLCPHTGHVIDLGAFSRKRPLNADNSGTVMG